MKRYLRALLSYSLATVSGLCLHPFDQEVIGMEGLTNLISMLDYILDTKRKRHITGGILLSASLLFGGLAMTVMSIKDEEDYNEQDD